MKKKFNMKAKIIGIAAIAAGAVAAVPSAVPQAVMAQEPAASTSTQQIIIPSGADYTSERKTISRTIHFMYKNADGSTTPVESTKGDPLEYTERGEIVKITVFNKKTNAIINTYYTDPVEFRSWESPEISGYTPDKENIPAKTYTWDDESEDVYVYYTKDPSKQSIEYKEFNRTIYYIYKDTDGSVIEQRSQEQPAKIGRYVYTDKNGNKTYGEWGTFEAKAINVPQVDGFKPDKTVVPAVTLSSPNDKFDDVYITYTKRPTKTETKKVTRKVNYIGNNIDGTTSDLGGITHTATISREVYTDTNGAVEVKRDWSTNKLPEVAVPDRDGYTKQQNKVPEVQVTKDSKDTTVNVYYKQKGYTVRYHLDSNSPVSDKTTIVRYGKLTNTLTLSQLNFSKANNEFLGWRVYRDCDDTWYLKDSAGNKSFKKLVNGQLPSGYTYVLYKNGEPVKQTAPSGEVHLYGQWRQRVYDVVYHLDEASAASPAKTTVQYGTLTKTKTLSQLNFSKTNYVFKGWKVYRDCDDTWYLKDSSGKNSFKKLNNGKLPAGYSFVLYKEGENVKMTAPSGTVHFYGQWEQRTYDVKYHKDDNAPASSMVTTVIYGNLTNTKTIAELGFSKAGSQFAGWKVYRDCDDSWYLKDSSGKNSFKKLVNGKLPAGYTYVLYKSGEPVKQTAPGGTVHLYAQWK